MGLLNLHDALSLAKELVIDGYSRQLKTLLETKHLYQRVTIDITAVVADTRSKVQDRARFDGLLQKFCEERFHPSEGIYYSRQRGEERVPSASLVVTNVKLYCQDCHSSEVFSPLYFVDAVNEILKPLPYGQPIHYVPKAQTFQLIFIAFQCQRCKGDPQGFIIRRMDHSLSIEGRSPIEHIEVPTYIPRKERRLFSDAVVAANAGKPLAALFYLRSFIEQFARRQTGILNRTTGDAIMDAYSKTLLEPVRDLIPSLKEWYEKLSIPIHSALDDANIFDEARREIERHFDMRRVHKVSELGVM